MNKNNVKARDIVFNLIKQDKIDIKMQRRSNYIEFKHCENTIQLLELIYTKEYLRTFISDFNNLEYGRKFKIYFYQE